MVFLTQVEEARLIDRIAKRESGQCTEKREAKTKRTYSLVAYRIGMQNGSYC